MNGGDRGGVGILLFSEVTLFEYNVSTISSPIVEVPIMAHKVKNPNGLDANHLAIYKRHQGYKLGITENKSSNR